MTPPALPDRPASTPLPRSGGFTLPPADRTAKLLTERLVPDDLWVLVRRAIPDAPKRPQGGGRPRADDREVLAAIAFLAGSGCSWRQLPPVFGVSWQTAHRRFTEWTGAGLWDSLCAATADHHGAPLRTDWSWTICHHIRKRAGLPCTAGKHLPGDRPPPAAED